MNTGDTMLRHMLRRLADELEMAGTLAQRNNRAPLADAMAELAEAVDTLRRMEFPGER